MLREAQHRRDPPCVSVSLWFAVAANVLRYLLSGNSFAVTSRSDTPTTRTRF
jgi:hypothetical protein